MNDGASQEFDYIIVGGGTAGCVLANRLTQSGRHRVLVIEAGGDNQHLYIQMPLGYGKAIGNPRFDWRYTTESEPGLKQRKLVSPRGKGLGGSSSINSMLYVRGQAADFDRWAREQGAPGWDWAHVAPHYRRLEKCDWNAAAERGTDGVLPITRVRPALPLTERILNAGSQAGLEVLEDYNASIAPEGVAHAQFTMARGRRAAALAAYLRPALARKNLDVRTNATVTEIAFEGLRAVGVSYRCDGPSATARARLETIICAGAVGSPELLERSGVGNADHLKNCGIRPLLDLPGVGENLQDHLGFGLQQTLRGVVSLNEELQGIRLWWNSVRYGLTRRGVLAGSHGPITGFARVHPDAETSDVQLFGSPTTMDIGGEQGILVLSKNPGVTISLCQLRPESRGSVHIVPPDGGGSPAITGNYLATELDRQVAIGAMRLGLKMLAQPAIAAVATQPQALAAAGNADLLDYVRANSGSAYHLCGSCRMGSDAGAVVDPQLRVRGVADLRIVDASIFPSLVSGNTMAATVLVAEMAAESMLSEARV